MWLNSPFYVKRFRWFCVKNHINFISKSVTADLIPVKNDCNQLTKIQNCCKYYC